MKKKGSQSQILLSLSDEMVRIRGKEDMLEIIQRKLKEYILFDDSFILRYNKKTRSCRPYIYHSEQTRSEDPEYMRSLDLEYPVADDSTEENNYPQVYDVATLLPLGIQKIDFMHRSGIKEFAVIKLIEGNELRGLFILLSEKSNSFKPEDLDLLHRLSYQISTATANIIANEEIAKREQEKELLLSLSHEISTTRSRAELLPVLQAKLKELFQVTAFGISLINEDGKTYSPFIVEHNDRIKREREFEQLLYQRYSIADPVFHQIKTAADPLTLVVDELAVMPEAPSFVFFWKKMGIKKVLGMPLRVGQKDLGCFIFHLPNPFNNNISPNFLKGVSAQISVRISNIIANEEIAKREEEKSILLSLTNEIAAVRNKNELLELLNAKLKRLFPIKGFGITLLNADGKTHSPFVGDIQEELKRDNHFKEAISQNYSVTDGVYNVFINANDPITLEVNELAQMADPPAYVDFWKKNEIKKVVGIAIRVSENKLGCFIILHDSLSNNSVNDNLLKGVSAQISVAISNISANEEIIKREEEKSTLLSISQEMAVLRNRNDLFQVVIKKMKVLFSINEFGIGYINNNDETYSSFTIDITTATKGHEDFDLITSAKYSIHDPIFSKVMNAEEPVYFDVNDLSEQTGVPPYVSFWKALGFQKVLCVALRVGRKNIGCAFLHFDSNPSIHKQINLVKGVCAQLSVAISNILASEDIKEREMEKSRLLSFSNAMASENDKIVIAKIIKTHLRDFFGIEDYIIHAISKDKKTFTPLMFDPQGIFVKFKSFQESLYASYDIDESVFNKIVQSENPIIISTEELLKQPKIPNYAATIKETGIKKIISTPIRLGHENIAFLNFRKSESSEFVVKQPLFKSICSQLAIAVSNIVAFEEIAKREVEKAMLLDLSNDMAKVRNKSELRQITDEKLKTLLSVNNISFCYVSPDGQTFGSFILDPKSPSVKHSEYGDITSAIHPVNDGIIDKVLASEDPLVFDMEAYIKTNVKVPNYLRMIYDVGMRQMLFSRLKNGEDLIGYLAITKKIKTLVDKNQLNLIKAISAQLSVALANIKANEQIENQINEINNYKNQLKEENLYLQEEINISLSNGEIIGESGEMKKVFHMVNKVATSDSTVLILGETGTGKELIARAVHNGSHRKNKLMIKVNCASIPPNLIESELFGHERGSFTGATERRLGKFELAHQGTLFLDEIGEMPLELQVKLLRALQEKEIERVGGKTTIKVDVRIIAATNRDLEKLMEDGKFRSDLFYRLNIFPIYLPPLRNRSEDIPTLAFHFLKRFSKKTGKQIKTFSNKAIQELVQYKWPGNIRELEHLIERSVLLTNTDTIKEILLPVQTKNPTTAIVQENIPTKTIDENERDYILKVLKHVRGRVSGEGGAAELLGIPPSTLNSRMKRLGIRKEHFG
jgi:transcriptional regulator with GAF, ATPase, and Fis domain